ncbi:ensconsin isoform X4 [Zootoca vivipara]|uniref:ensconsin isoform X4 n=1 Tax=Zootoca vivipara TaxID=8524 RepID=UPI00293BA26E|nr:ensconsin isoform X4 [Zootoca vivipara]
MAEGNGVAAGPESLAAASPPPLPPLRGLREKMVAAAQVLAEERRSQSGPSPVSVQSPVSMKSSTRPVIDGSTLRTEERQRLARERREERDKQQAAKETQILEKEKKAKLQYEKQMEERQKRLKEQKLKEEQRRVAVEEKRKQKLEEDKERYEAVLHRTLERSQRLETRQKRWSWGGSITDSDGKPESPIPDEGSKRSTSSANLKQAENVISKRLSSSAARLNSPSKGSTKRSSSLNRLNNKVPPNSEQPEPKGLQAEQKAPSSAVSSPAHAPKVPLRSRSTDRLKTAASPSGSISPETAQKSELAQPPSSTGRRTPSPSLPGPRRSPSPANVGKRAPSPAAIRQKSHPSSPKRQWPPSPVLASKPAPIQRPSITPNVLNLAKKQSDPACRPKERLEHPEGRGPGPAAVPHPSSEREVAAAAPKTKEDASSKTTLATTTAEEAARILAEKRRLAREQREREDQERAQREEAERIRKEEVAMRTLEKQAQLEEALREPEDERRAGEEEPQRQEEQEKMAELQLQREEAEATALKEAEKQRREREWIVQQNKQERLQRKKRIEEIMRRTRKAEQNDTKNEDKSNEEEDEGVEEDDELGLEKQDQPEKAKYDSSLKDGPEAVCDWTASEEERSKMEPDGVFVNGDEQEEVDRRNNGGGNLMYLTQAKEASPPAKDMVAENSEILLVNEADRSAGFLSNLNGNSTAWNFEEIIDLGIHPKTTIAAEKAAQSLKDAAVVPASPRLAFEDGSPRNSFTNPIETASEL